jgi:RNA polymerase sigma factor (TIGR02999 family)
MPSSGEVTRLLARVRDGDAEAEAHVFALLYDDLTRIATRHLRAQRAGHTLEPSALVHEAYLKIAGAGNEATWRDSAHALAVAARAMRQVLANHARDRAAAKRGGKDRGERLTISGVADGEVGEVDAAALHEALDRLAALDARQARIAELRVLGGLEVERIATLLGVSPRTVELDWRMAKATLRRLLGDEPPARPPG